MKKIKHVTNLSALLFIIAILLSLSIAVGANGTTTDPTYKGAEYCGLCHEETYEAWNQTNHANAIMLIQNASGNFYSIGSTDNLNGTPSRIYNEEDFRTGSCMNCHVTGGNSFDPLGANQTWPERDTDPEKFLNIQCEVCHGQFEPKHWKPTETDMTINYSSAACELCHTGSHDFSHSQSAHVESLTDLLDTGYPSEDCLHCMSTQGFIGLPVTLNTTDLESVSCVACHDPHSHEYDAQLRTETSTELCGSCHSGSRHPQDEFFFDSAHDKAGLECTSCHGQGTMLSHGSESEVTNHTWGIYEMHYPYNQTMDEEPIVCSTCHTQEWSTSQLNVIQTTISKANVNVTTIIEEVESAISLANATTGVNQTKVNQATSLIEQASDKVNLVNYDGSSGFHNPEETFAMLSDAMRLANEAGTLALEAQGEAQVANLEVRTNSVRNIAIAGIIGALILGLAIGKKW